MARKVVDPEKVRIDRKVEYWSVRFTDREGQVVQNPSAMWAQLASMAQVSRAIPAGDDTTEAVQVKVQKDGSVDGRFYRTKTSDFPMVGEGDIDEPLDLPLGKGLRFPAHFVWWPVARWVERGGVAQPPGEGLMAFEANQHAPRAAGLAHYFDKVEGITLQCVPARIVHQRVWEELEREPMVHRFSVRVTAKEVRATDDAYDASMLHVLSEIPGAEELEIVIRPKRRGILNILPSLKWIKDQVSEHQAKGRVLLPSGQDLDLLNPVLVYKADFAPIRRGQRTIDPQEAWNVLRRTTFTNRTDIGKLIGRVWPEGLHADPR